MYRNLPLAAPKSAPGCAEICAEMCAEFCAEICAEFCAEICAEICAEMCAEISPINAPKFLKCNKYEAKRAFSRAEGSSPDAFSRRFGSTVQKSTLLARSLPPRPRRVRGHRALFRCAPPAQPPGGLEEVAFTTLERGSCSGARIARSQGETIDSCVLSQPHTKRTRSPTWVDSIYSLRLKSSTITCSYNPRLVAS